MFQKQVDWKLVPVLLLVVLALFILGGGVIHNFAFAMLVGVLIGTYSSVFVASPVLIFWDERKKASANS